jgi:hypothetical protein
MPTWRQQILAEIIDFCNAHGSRSFTLQEFTQERLGVLQAFRPENKNVAAKIRQQFQFLRDEGLLTFVNNNGFYTLRGLALLEHEMEAINAIHLWDLRDAPSLPAGFGEAKQTPLLPERASVLPETTEHLVETYVRNKGWAKQARDTFGTDCMICDCDNRFHKPDGSPYIEVHHIVPLCEGGEDGIWNLSMLCAHHHRMAHFADHMSKKKIRNFLQKEVDKRLG